MSQSLSSLRLDAFYEVARTLSFSRAAQALHISQSALSQRIINLEQELERSLFVRDPAGVRLTESGEELLRYCQMRSGLEADLLNRFRMDARTGLKESLAGVVRIGGFSSIMRSVIMPALQDVIRSHSGVQMEIVSRETHELPKLLRSGEIDFAVLDAKVERSGLESHLLGHEENVLVRSSKLSCPPDVFLDHDPNDMTTELFLKQQGRKLTARKRHYLDNIDGVIEGAALGWGGAVVPRHLLRGRRDLTIVSDLKSHRSPVYLHYYTQPFYSRLHQAVVKALSEKSAKLLHCE